MEDKYLTVVEEHVERLGEMAKNIQEELQIQDRMVDDLGNRIDTAQEHVANVNTRMKVSSAAVSVVLGSSRTPRKVAIKSMPKL